MVLDTSAIVAMLCEEPEREVFLALIAADSSPAMSAVTLLEAAIVLASKKSNPGAARLVDDLVHEMNVEVASVDADVSRAARQAYCRFGRGYHSAGLNFADCFSYVLAKLRNEPLLFKGDDFAKTDVIPAWRP